MGWKSTWWGWRFGQLITAGAGYAAAGPAGLAAPIAGFALKKAANASTARQAQLLDEMVRARSELARTMPHLDKDAIKREITRRLSLAIRGAQVPVTTRGESYARRGAKQKDS